MIFYAIFDQVPHLGPRVHCSWRVCIFQQKMHIYLITLSISGNTVVENTTHNSKMKGSNRAAGYKREREIFMPKCLQFYNNSFII
jgi:hypothetical protein